MITRFVCSRLFLKCRSAHSEGCSGALDLAVVGVEENKNCGGQFSIVIFDCRLGEAIANQQSTNQQFQLTAWSFFSLRSREVGWIPRIFAACVLLLPVAVSTCWMESSCRCRRLATCRRVGDTFRR